MRCLDPMEDKDYEDLLYQELLSETKEFAVSDIPEGYRTALEVRAYWNDVRAQLKVKDEDVDASEWPKFRYWTWQLENKSRKLNS